MRTRKISLSRLLNITLGLLLVVILVFGWFYLKGRSPAELLSSRDDIGDTGGVPSYRYLFAVYGKGKDFSDPHEVLACNDSIYVSDYRNGRIAVFNDRGTPTHDISVKNMKNPAGLFWDGANLWVADPTASKVFVFNSAGNLKDTITVDRTVMVVDVAVDNGVLYLLNNRQMTVEKYDLKTRKKIGAFGGLGNEPGRLYYPSSLAIHNNLVYVVDSLNNRINVYTKDGGFVRAIPKQQKSRRNGLYVPRGIAFDKENRLYTAEGLANVVMAVTPQGEAAFQIKNSENINGQTLALNLPTDVCIDSQSRLYVLEQGNNRVLVYGR